MKHTPCGPCAAKAKRRRMERERAMQARSKDGNTPKPKSDAYDKALKRLKGKK